MANRTAPHYAHVENKTKEVFRLQSNQRQAKQTLLRKLQDDRSLAKQLAEKLKPTKTCHPIVVATSSKQLYSLLVSATCVDPKLKLDLFIEGSDSSFTESPINALRDYLDIQTRTYQDIIHATNRDKPDYNPQHRAVVVILRAGKRMSHIAANEIIAKLLKLENAVEAKICIEDNSFIFNGHRYGQTDSFLTAEQSEKFSSLEDITNWAFSNHEDEHEARMAILSQLHHSKFGTQVVKNIARSLRPSI